MTTRSLFLSLWTAGLLLAGSVHAGVITGKVTDPSGNPIPNVVVQAMDADWTSGDDFMGDDTTNSAGVYTINYRNKKWDGLTGGGPDIYLQVVLRAPIKVVEKTGKYGNHDTGVPIHRNIKVDGTCHTKKLGIGDVSLKSCTGNCYLSGEKCMGVGNMFNLSCHCSSGIVHLGEADPAPGGYAACD